MNQLSIPVTLAVPVDHRDQILGPNSAKVTVIEYGDFECASCGQAYPAVNLMLKHFGDDVRFVFRHFPQREVLNWQPRLLKRQAHSTSSGKCTIYCSRTSCI